MSDTAWNPRDPQRRTLPHNLDAEASILGGVLLRNEVLLHVLGGALDIDDFYDHRHKVVWQAIYALHERQRPIDVVTLEAEIETQGKLEAIGGIAFLGEIAARVPTPDNVLAYAEIVHERAVTRRAMLSMSELMEAGYSGELGGDALVAAIGGIALNSRSSRERPIQEIGELIQATANRAQADLERRARGELVFAGVPCGVEVIDQRVGGLPIGLLSLVLARPGLGKSSVAMSFCEASYHAGEVSILVSYEDSGESTGQRGLAQESNIPTEDIRARNIPSLRSMAAGVASGLRRKELFLEASGLTVERLIARVRSENIRRVAAGKKKIRGVHIDYLQRMPMPSGKQFYSRDVQIGHVSAMLADWARDDEIAVVAYCQLNRDIEKRDDHRPKLSDIRESGNLEQDGKFIIGLHRPWLYDKEMDPADLRMFVLKNHQGQSQGEIPLHIDLPTHKIFNSALDYQHWRARRG